MPLWQQVEGRQHRDLLQYGVRNAQAIHRIARQRRWSRKSLQLNVGGSLMRGIDVGPQHPDII
jgi:hypothetical protein